MLAKASLPAPSFTKLSSCFIQWHLKLVRDAITSSGRCFLGWAFIWWVGSFSHRLLYNQSWFAPCWSLDRMHVLGISTLASLSGPRWCLDRIISCPQFSLFHIWPSLSALFLTQVAGSWYLQLHMFMSFRTQLAHTAFTGALIYP